MLISAINPTLEFRWSQTQDVAASDLDAVQTAIGAYFPPDYREFLLLGGCLGASPRRSKWKRLPFRLLRRMRFEEPVRRGPQN